MSEKLRQAVEDAMRVLGRIDPEIGEDGPTIEQLNQGERLTSCGGDDYYIAQRAWRILERGLQ